MDEATKKRIKDCGLKQKYLAGKLGLTPNYLSMCLSGTRKLSEQKLKQLKKLI